MLTIDVNNIDWPALLAAAEDSRHLSWMEADLIGKKKPPTGLRTPVAPGLMGFVQDVFSLEGNIVVRVRIETDKARRVCKSRLAVEAKYPKEQKEQKGD